jgi:hypothetical protein
VNGSIYNRRSFLQASAAASSVCLIDVAAGACPASAGWASPASIDLYKLVYTDDHPAAVAFGRAAGASGIAVQAIGRDVTALWYADLYHRWRQGPAAIAGMTPVRVAFCLQTLAQDAGLRMVFRAQHTPMASGRLEHRLIGPRSVLEGAGLLDAAEGWSSGAAALVARCPAEISSQSTRTLISGSATGFAFREPLVSWVLAPVSRA